MSTVGGRQQAIINNISAANSRNDEKIAEMLGKVELNKSGLVSLWQETTELSNTTRTAIGSGPRTENVYRQKQTTRNYR